MLIQKQLLEKLIELASDSAEYLNSAEHWITVKPHGDDSKGVHVKVEDGETSKQAVERKFGADKLDHLKSKEDYFKGMTKLARDTFNFQHKNKVIDAVVEGKMTKEKALELHSKDYANLEKDIDYRIKDTKDTIEKQKQTKETMQRNEEIIKKAKQEKITEKEKETQDKQTISKEEMVKTPLNEYLKQSGFKRKNILDLLAYDHYEAVKKAKEQEIADKEYKDVKGFAEDRSEMQKGKILKTLNEKVNYTDFGFVTRKEAMGKLLEVGYLPKTREQQGKTKYMLLNPDTKRYYDVNKTEYEYTEHLSNL